jgi:hypothetical protein
LGRFTNLGAAAEVLASELVKGLGLAVVSGFAPTDRLRHQIDSFRT